MADLHNLKHSGFLETSDSLGMVSSEELEILAISSLDIIRTRESSFVEHSRFVVTSESSVVAVASYGLQSSTTSPRIHRRRDGYVALSVILKLLQPLQLVGTILPSLCSHTPAHLVVSADVFRERQHRDPWTLRKNHELSLHASYELLGVYYFAIRFLDLTLESILCCPPENC